MVPLFKHVETVEKHETTYLQNWLINDYTVTRQIMAKLILYRGICRPADRRRIKPR
jgi:hypothetical protein